MLPNNFGQENDFSHFISFGLNNPVRNNFIPSSENQNLISNGIEFQSNANLDAILNSHRRKMLRRAANRRSAQLSRARKKAHLEDLKSENVRLQRLADILESQAELTICITPAGKITYISENTINFFKLNFSNEEIDEDPTHINQLFTPESVKSIIEIVTELRKYSGEISELLFAFKEVYFHDSFGQPLMGNLRCSRVHRRIELSTYDSMEKPLNPITENPIPFKKAKMNPKSQSSSSKSDGQDLTNINILADCVSSLSKEPNESKDHREEIEELVSADEHEEEFVCTIRTTNTSFVPLHSNKHLLMFSSILSTANVQAHNTFDSTSNDPSSITVSNISSDKTSNSSSTNPDKPSTSSEEGSSYDLAN